MSQTPESNKTQTQTDPQLFEGVIELSNNNFKVLNDALELMHEVAKNSNSIGHVRYYFNIDINDIVLIEYFNFQGERKARIFLKNGLVVEVNSWNQSIDIISIHSCYCGE